MSCLITMFKCSPNNSCVSTAERMEYEDADLRTQRRNLEDEFRIKKDNLQKKEGDIQRARNTGMYFPFSYFTICPGVFINLVLL